MVRFIASDAFRTLSLAFKNYSLSVSTNF